MQRFGKHINPATILALVALVFAVTGGAYAASSSGGGAGGGSHVTARVAKAKSKKKSSSSGKPGPRGPAGAIGPVGPAGPAGAAGAKGENGSQGSQGPAGSNGSNGESVTVAAASNTECSAGGTKLSNGTGSGKACNGANGTSGESVKNTKLSLGDTNCPEGGAEFKVGTGGATYACNGVPIKLEPGQTESGHWMVQISGTKFAGSLDYVGFVGISFPLTFKQGENPAVHFVRAGETTSAECPGPEEAAEGSLCLYAQGEYPKEEIIKLFSGTANAYGSTLVFENAAKPATEPEGYVYGVWSTTAG